MEKQPNIGSYSFEDAGYFNPLDRFVFANQIAKDITSIVKLVEHRLELQGAAPTIVWRDTRMLLFDEILDELVEEIKTKSILIGDSLLQDYINAPITFIDQHDYSPEAEVPLFRILKACGFSKKTVMKCYDYSFDSTLPIEFMGNNNRRLEIIEKVYDET